MTRTLRIAMLIGRVTFQEISRSKIFYSTLLCAFFLLALSYLFGRVDFARPDRMLLDFGLITVSLACSAIGILTGAPTLGAELERRTLYLALSKPISRGQFLMGKMVGLMGALFVNWFLLSCAFCLLYWINGGELTSTLFMALSLIWLQSVILAAVSLCVATVSTIAISIIVSIGFYLLGNSVGQIRFLYEKAKNPIEQNFLYFLEKVTPNFENLSLAQSVTYGFEIPISTYMGQLLYGLVWTSIFVLLASVLLKRRKI